MKKRDPILDNLRKLYELTEGKPFISKDIEQFTAKFPGYKNVQSLTQCLITGGQNAGYIQPMKEGDRLKKSHRSYTWVKIPVLKKKTVSKVKAVTENQDANIEVLKRLFGQKKSFCKKEIPDQTNGLNSAAWRYVLDNLVNEKVLSKEPDVNDKRINVYSWVEKKLSLKPETVEDVILSPYKITQFERIGSQEVVQVINNENRVIEKLIAEEGDMLDLFLSLMIQKDILSEVGKGQKGRIFILNWDKYNQMSVRQPLLKQLKFKRDEILNREKELLSQIDQMKNGDKQNQMVELEKLEKEIEEFEEVLKNLKQKQRLLKQECESLEKSASSRMKIPLGIVKSDLDMVRKRLNLITTTTQCSNTELEGILKLL